MNYNSLYIGNSANYSRTDALSAYADAVSASASTRDEAAGRLMSMVSSGIRLSRSDISTILDICCFGQ